jgi:ribonucleoside-diphosphate reductase beta chain
MSLIVPSIGYKPFRYPWAYGAYERQQQMHWLPGEVPLTDDVKDWQINLTPEEKNLLTQIFRFFTQADVSVAENYVHNYLPIFKPTEIIMMLTVFAASEANHVASYSHLLDTVGMPESEYTVFMQVKEMKDKYDYFSNFSVDSPREIAKTLAGFGAFTEGLQLFASFAMLLNFSRFGKMKGMCQIIAWSVRDETLHCENIIKLFHTYCAENPGLFDKSLKDDLLEICKTIVEHEDAFIDLAFALGPVQGMTADEVKQYIRFIADRRLLQLHLPTYFNVRTNPLPWLDEILNAPEFANFFENRPTEYNRDATEGNWEDVF